jgi:hypothetical protein
LSGAPADASRHRAFDDGSGRQRHILAPRGGADLTPIGMPDAEVPARTTIAL